MEIRLAYEQGLLTQSSLNAFQLFALRYHMNMSRRLARQQMEEQLQRQTWYLAPERYNDLFFEGAFEPEPLTIGGRPVEEVVDDVDEVDAYFENLERKRKMTGAQMFEALDDEEGWV